MAIASYAYLKLKIPRPTEVNTMEARTQQVLDYE
jgi:phage FluMu protein Com